jgi:hypothetical protein
MAISKRDKRALQVGAAALAVWVILRFAAFPVWDHWQQQRSELPLRETALIKYRQALAGAGAEEQTAKSLKARLQRTESGLLTSATPALAAAEFQDWIRQSAASHSIELRSSQFLDLRPMEDGYTQVPLGLQFQCRLGQLVEFLSDLRAGPKIVGVPRLQIQSNGGSDKLITVSLTAAGVMRSQHSQGNPSP